jgi:hypothetical protein
MVFLLDNGKLNVSVAGTLVQEDNYSAEVDLTLALFMMGDAAR